ncbi:MAG: hypothetical protein HY660_02520 [Armatimonadetes bacterium]|nr:hypothetical protein [Armatimonadota bacterium]
MEESFCLLDSLAQPQFGIVAHAVSVEHAEDVLQWPRLACRDGGTPAHRVILEEAPDEIVSVSNPVRLGVVRRQQQARILDSAAAEYNCARPHRDPPSCQGTGLDHLSERTRLIGASPDRGHMKQRHDVLGIAERAFQQATKVRAGGEHGERQVELRRIKVGLANPQEGSDILCQPIDWKLQESLRAPIVRVNLRARDGPAAVRNPRPL